MEKRKEVARKEEKVAKTKQEKKELQSDAREGKYYSVTEKKRHSNEPRHKRGGAYSFVQTISLTISYILESKQ